MILCEEYLASRGITDESIKTYGLECVDVCAFPADTIKQRLGRKLPEGVNELIWFPLLNGKREITSWIACGACSNVLRAVSPSCAVRTL